MKQVQQAVLQPTL